MRFSSLTKRGVAADRPARINRLIPNETRTVSVSSAPVFPNTRTSATNTKVKARSEFAVKRICRREYLSSSVPTTGPTREYGSNTTANANAALCALAARSGEKSKKAASAL